MSRFGVVAAEVARARIFTLEVPEVPEFDPGPRLVERETLANPQRLAHESDIWSDTRRGAHREHVQGQRAGQTVGIPHHNFDEHREQNQRAHNRAFAKQIVDRIHKIAASEDVDRVILCAEKQMLGYLRPALNSINNGIEIREVPKGLANLSPHELHRRLAKEGHLPPQRNRVPPG